MQYSQIKNPVVIVNFKTYLEATGEKAFALAKIMDEVMKETGVTMVAASQFFDVREISSSFDLPVFVQHIDGVNPGSNTGHILAEAVKDAGASGTLINHSENRIGEDAIRASIEACKRVGLISILCVEDVSEAEKYSDFGADYIAIEPPELIGGDVSISSANPSLISDSVEVVGAGRLLAGAGVKDGSDVAIAKELGASGILVASGVCKVEDPRSVLLDFARNLE